MLHTGYILLYGRWRAKLFYFTLSALCSKLFVCFFHFISTQLERTKATTTVAQGIHSFFKSTKIRIDVASHRAWVAGGLNESSPSLYGQGYLDSAEAWLCLHVPFAPPCRQARLTTRAEDRFDRRLLLVSCK